MFSLKIGAVRAGVLAAMLGIGGPALAQNPTAPMTLPIPVAVAPVAPPEGVGAPPGAVPAPPGAPATPACTTCESVFDWKKVPRVRPTPRAARSRVPTATIRARPRPGHRPPPR